MGAPDPIAVVPISPGIPWYFAPGIILLAAIAVLLLVTGTATILAWRLDRKARKEGKYSSTPYAARGTLTACVGAIVVGILVGVNFEAIWYRLNPELTSAAENEQSVIAQFSEQGATNIQLRETSPQHPIQVLDENAWDRGFPLTFLYSCDASEFNLYGNYPAYEGWEWSLPVTYSAPDSDEPFEAELERVVADGECHFTLLPEI